jgi:hypothetical protein
MKKYSVTFSDQIDDEGNETHFIVVATDSFAVMARLVEFYHGITPVVKITIVELLHAKT